jgi:hypothetical protein
MTKGRHVVLQKTFSVSISRVWILHSKPEIVMFAQPAQNRPIFNATTAHTNL